MNRFKLIILSLFAAISSMNAATQRPNIIVVMTDDQGYGDLGCNGNTVIQTPNIDRLRGQGLQLDNFHVDPTCAPTRAAWMTGRYSNRVGVWHTVQGRNLLRSREVTMGIFSAITVTLLEYLVNGTLVILIHFVLKIGVFNTPSIMARAELVKLQTIGAMIISTILI